MTTSAPLHAGLFTKREIEDLVSTCDVALDDAFLEGLRAEYNDKPENGDFPNYYRFLYRLSQLRPGLKFVELGCKYGNASLHFLNGGGGHAVLIDVGDHVRRENFRGLPATIDVCPSVSEQAKKTALLPGVPDIVMIDTDHSYNTTLGEFDIWSEVVNPGGLILFDDIDAYTTFGREDFACGRFWQELKAKHPRRCLDAPSLHPGGYGFGIYFMDDQ